MRCGRLLATLPLPCGILGIADTHMICFPPDGPQLT